MAPPARGQLLARGRTAEVYAWATGQVLKLFYEWVPQEWIQREVQVGRYLAASTLPTPRLLDDVSVDGRHGLVFERVEGPTMLGLLPRKPWLLPKMARHFADLHLAIHERRAPDLPPVRPYLQAAILKAEGLPSQVRDQTLKILAGLPDGDALCHFDFHPDQVVLAIAGPTILDWMTAFRGHPLADVARTSTLIRFGQAPHANWLMQRAVNTVRSAFHNRYIRRYMRLHYAGIMEDLRSWMLPVATARLADNVSGERESILDFLKTSLPNPMAAKTTVRLIK